MFTDAINEVVLVCTRLLTFITFLSLLILGCSRAWSFATKKPIKHGSLVGQILAVAVLLLLETLVNSNDMLRNVPCFRERVAAGLGVFVGVPLALTAMILAQAKQYRRKHLVTAVGSVCLGGLLSFAAIYVDNLKNFQYYPGLGIISRNLWINPPLEAMQDGDLVLNHYDNPFDEPWGHGEIAVRKSNGVLGSYTDRKEEGIIFRNMSEFMAECKRDHRMYTVLRPIKRISAEEKLAATKKANDLLAWNIQWKKDTNAKIDAFNRDIDNAARSALFLLPRGERVKLSVHFHLAHQTGYNFVGLVDGMDFPPLYTCISICDMMLIDEYHVPIQKYGRGLLGIFGGLNPKYPCRYAGDPALHGLDRNDKARFEQSLKLKALQAK